jgi:oligopeptide transport system substrate-binding protein
MRASRHIHSWLWRRVAFVALLLTLLTGCGQPFPFPQPTPDPKLPDSQQIFQPLEIGPNAGDLATLDPALINFGVDYQLAQLLFPGLVTLDEQQRMVDWAAERHEVSSDGMTYTFHLRRGMTWSDGTPLDASTFAYSINRALDPCTGSDVASYLFNIKGAATFNAQTCPTNAQVSSGTLIGKSIVVADPLTLKLTLEAPAGDFLASLTYPTAWAVPGQLIEQYGVRWTDHLADNAGFGGSLFKLTRWDHQGHLGFERNERFWGQKPELKEVQYSFFKDTGAAWAAYKAGVGDIGYPVTDELDIAKALIGSSFHQVSLLAFSYLTLDWKQAPFDDIRMRKAFWLTLDRQAIAHDIYKDTVQPTIHLLPEGLPGYNADLRDAFGRTGKEALTADLTTARRLANEYATEKCGGDFVRCPPITYFITQYRPTNVRLTQALLNSWQNVFPGWPLSPVLRGLQIKARTSHLTASGWGADFPDPSDFISMLWTTNASYNRNFVSISQVDALCVQADGMSDLSARIPLYQQAEQLLVNQVAAIPYAQPLQTYDMRARVSNWRLAPTGQTPLSVWQSAYIRR